MEVLSKLDVSIILALIEEFEKPLYAIRLLRSLKNNIDYNAEMIKMTLSLVRNLLEEEWFVLLIELVNSSLEKGVSTKLIQKFLKLFGVFEHSYALCLVRQSLGIGRAKGFDKEWEALRCFQLLQQKLQVESPIQTRNPLLSL